MKRNELIIGYWYQSVRFQVPIILTADDICDLVARAGGAGISSYIKEMFAPIPLTEDWLKKLGFEKILEADNVFTKIKPDEVYFNLYQYGNEFDWVHREDTLSSVKHVHQLQNLYFALAQKELTTTINQTQ